MPDDPSLVSRLPPRLTPTVFLVDDDVPFLATMARFLRSSGFAVTTFSSAADFLAEREPETGGCVVADLQMPGMNGIDLQNALSRSANPLPIVFLTGHGDIPTSVKAMRQGAEDFLTKRARPEELLTAVQRALSRDRLDREQRARSRELHALFDRLTPREREVMAQVLRGQLNKQIAEDLGIVERSVKRHRTSIMAKLQVRSVAQLTQLAWEGQWPGILTRQPITPSSAANSSAPG